MTRFTRRSLAPTLIGITVLLACSGDSPTDPDTPDGPATLTVTEEGEWSAGGSVPLTGLTLDPATADELSAEVGGEPALIMTNLDGELQVVLPLFLDETTLWSAPPSGPQSIVIRRGTEEIARTSQGVVVNTLEESPGSTMALLDNYLTRLGHFQDLIDRTGMAAGTEEQHVIALLAGLQEVLTSTEPGSLRDLIDSASSEELRLSDALVAGTGFGREVDAITSLIAGIVPRIRDDRAAAKAGGCGIEFDDETLATMMQLAVFYHRFGEWFLADMAQWSSNVDWGTGLVQLVASGTKLPAISQITGIINLTLSALDLFWNKYGVAWLPTVILDMSLDAEETSLDIGDITATSKRICVSNVPPPITLTDFIGQLINVMGLMVPVDQVEGIAQGVSNLFLDKVNAGIAQYASDHPEVSVEAELFSMPLVHWTAELDDPRFIELISGKPEVVAPLPLELEWEIQDVAGAVGETNISYRPSTDPEAIILENLLGFIEYNAGAFGEMIVASDDVTITVGRELILEVTFAETIPSEGTIIGVDVFFRDSDGVLIPEPNVYVGLDVTGGTADNTTGSTDIEGYYSTLVLPSAGSSEVTVVVTAIAVTEETATETVSASAAVGELFVSITGLGGRVSPGEPVSITVTAGGVDDVEGIGIGLSVDGGSVEDETSAGGVLTATVRLDAEDNELEVEATATYGGQQATAMKSALRTNSIEIISREIFLLTDTGATVCTEIGVPCDEEFDDRYDSSDVSFSPFTDSLSSGGSGSMEGMLVSGHASVSADAEVSMSGGQFSGATFSASCDGTISLSNPNHEVSYYGAGAGSRASMDLEFIVWGDPASFSISGSVAGDSYDVDLDGDELLFECDSGDAPCSSFSASGVLEPGEEYDFDVWIDAGGHIEWQDGCSDCTDSGTQSGESTVDVTLSVSH